MTSKPVDGRLALSSLDQLVEAKEVETRLGLQVGLEVTLTIKYEDSAIRAGSHVRGWKEGEFLLIDVPVADRERPSGKSAISITMHCLADGRLLSFQCRFLRKIMEPSESWYLSYPTVSESRSLRNAGRVDTALPATVNGTPCTVLDLSRYGALVDLGEDAGQFFRLEGLVVTLSISVPGRTDETVVTGEVRNVDGTFAGVLFEGDDAEMTGIGEYLEAVERAGARRRDVPRA